MLYANTNPILFRPGIRKDFRDRWDQYPPEYPNFMKTGTTSTPEISAATLTGPSRLYELGDGEPVSYEDIIVGPKAVAIDREFGLGMVVSRKAIEDDLYGLANQNAKWLADSARLTYEYRAAALLDDAFTGTFFKSMDGLPLLSASHTLLGTSALFANMPSQQVGLSVTGITALIDLANHQVNQNGDPIPVNLDTLVIGNNAGDQNRALQIWNSELEPFTAENQENALRLRMTQKGGNMPSKGPVVSHYKSNPKSYFMIDSKFNDAHFDIKRPVEMEDTKDFDTGAYKYKVTTRFMVYVFDFIGWFGSNPT